MDAKLANSCEIAAGHEIAAGGYFRCEMIAKFCILAAKFLATNY